MRERARALLSWSSGKDSAWALHVLRQTSAVEVVGLLTTVNETVDRVSMHAVRRSVLRAQAVSVGLPLFEVDIPSPCSNEQYEAAMSRAMGRAVADGVSAVAFGDLFLEDVRRYREEKLAPTGLEALFPLWGADTFTLSRQMVDAGLEAFLTCVDPKQLDPAFAGRAYDKDLLADLPKGVDPCGENGEFHTFVHDGPIFDRPLPIRAGKVVERDGFVFADATLD
jgi:uncharacterized protein (TIGR00290 family)